MIGGRIVPAADSEASIVQVSDKIFVLKDLGESGNVAFLVTTAGVLVVDSGESPACGRTIIEKIREKTAQPIRYLVLTHYHGDHTFGLQAFPPDTIIIAQENLPQNQARDAEEIKAALAKYLSQITEIKEKIQEISKKKAKQRAEQEERLKKAVEGFAFYQQPLIVTPTITYDKKMTIRLGGETVQIIYPGKAHTGDNTIVFFPGQKVLHMGDMVFYKCHPYIDWQAGSDTANWIQQLREAEKWSVEKVIPGHGEMAGKEALAEQADYLIDLRAAVVQQINKGIPLDTMKKIAVPARWAGLDWTDLWPLAIEAAYHDLKGGQTEKE